MDEYFLFNTKIHAAKFKNHTRNVLSVYAPTAV